MTEISCDTCIAACCRAGSALVLTDDEAYRQRHHMTWQRVAKPKPTVQDVPVKMEAFIDGSRVGIINMITVPAHRGFYILLQDCGRLDDEHRCTDYDHRPVACSTYEVGSELCLNARAAFGLDGHEASLTTGMTLAKQNVKRR